MRRALALSSVLLPALGGLAVASILDLGDRSSCPLDGGPCIIGPTFAWLHPFTPAVNHVFGALVFLAPTALGAATTAVLMLRLRRRAE